MSYIKADVKNVYGKQTKCRCPRCGIIHKMLVDWREGWICPKYCQPCKHLVENMSGGMDEGSAFNKRAINVGR